MQSRARAWKSISDWRRRRRLTSAYKFCCIYVFYYAWCVFILLPLLYKNEYMYIVVKLVLLVGKHLTRVYRSQ